MLSKNEWFDLPAIEKFDKGFKNKEFDEEMALGLLNETQEHWCGSCDNYKRGECGCYFPDFKKEMIKKIKEHFNPKPYTFEDLKPNMWIWDNNYKVCRQVHKLYNNGTYDVVQFKSDQLPKFEECLYFEENRFYPLTKACQEGRKQ